MNHRLIVGALFLAACDTRESEPSGPWYPESNPADEGAAADFSPPTSPGAQAEPCAYAQNPGAAACPRTERALRDDDGTALGFEAETFLALITGEHRTQLSWEASMAASGSTELVLEVEPLGEVQFVDQESGDTGFDDRITFGNTGGVYLRCGDRLAVDARLRIRTSDGALDELVEARVEADSGRFARATVQLPAADIAGSLRPSLTVTPELPQSSPTQLTLALGISEFGLEGTLDARAQFEDPEAGDGLRCAGLGRFALPSSCGPGAMPLSGDGQLLGLSFPGALAQLNATSPATLADTGATLELAFEATPEPTCMSIDTPASLASVLRFPARVQLASSDGRVGGALDVQLTAEARGGALERVTAAAEDLVPDPTGLSDLAPSYAILQPLTWSQRESGGFELLIETRGQSSGGVLRALGENLSCQSSRPCEEVCPGPGCTATLAEKWGVRWGELSVGDALPMQVPND